MNNCIAAIDIGTSKIATIVGEKTSSGIRIIGYSEAQSEGVHRGSVLNIQKVMNSISPTIREVNEQVATLPDTENYRIREIYAGISGPNLKSFSTTLKRIRTKADMLITSEEIQGMLEEMHNTRVDAGKQIYQVVSQYYNVDEQMGITDPVGMEGKEIEGTYKLFIGSASNVGYSKSVYDRLNLKVKKTILNPIASAEAVLSEDDKELGTAMVDIGGGTTEIAIYHDNILRHVAIIPFGGNSITEDIRQVCGISIKNAELLKRQHGTCISDFAPDNKVVIIRDGNGNTVKEVRFKLLASAIEARVSEILATVLHEIELSGYRDKIRNGIVLTGGTAYLNHIQVLAKHICNMDVKIYFPGDVHITSNSLQDVNKPGASTAVGLIIKGFENQEGIGEQAEHENDGTIFGDSVPETAPSEDIQPTKTKTKTKEKKKGNLKSRLGGIVGGFGGLFEEDDNEA